MVNFLSQIAVSLSGFFATIVLTRFLGKEKYGTYVLVISVLTWIAIPGNLGISNAIKKRVSEADGGNYVVSGAISQFGLYVVVAGCLLLVRPYLNAYMETDATLFLVLLLGIRLLRGVVQAVLDGQQLVHISSLLSPMDVTGRSIAQVAFVLSGFGIAGAFAGYAVGGLVAALVGAYFVSFDPSLPSHRDFARLKSYAQFSWLASVKGRTFLSMDTLVLAVFVSNSLIAVYEVAWNLASLFAIFGGSISRTLFPRISKIASSEESDHKISELLRISLAYSGLFIIPGLVGSAIIGDIILTVYGTGFEIGYYILLILTFARLLYSYKNQFLMVIDGVDRPDLTFRINGVFVAVNLTLNIVFIWQYGWYGAAAATMTSAVLGLVLGYYYANKILTVEIPVLEIGKQVLAAAIMGLLVYGSRLMLADSLPVAVLLTAVGAGMYFSVLLGISREFRATVLENLPIDVPFLRGDSP